MSSHSASTTRAGTAAADERRSLAQTFALVVGATLVLVGIVGFIADSSFATGSPQGSNLIIFEVNGWHNVVHLLTGALLLAGAGRVDSARAVTLIFAVGYGLVTLIGLIDGSDVIGLVPVNPADNVLHIVLTVAAFAIYAASSPRGAETAPNPR